MEEYILYISLGLSGLTFLFFLILNFRLNGLIKKYRGFMNGLGDKDVENLMSSYLNNLNKLEKEVHIQTNDRILELERKMPHCVQHVGIVNYNAFDNVGNDMSFSIAVMDERKNGYILTGIYSRDHSYVYSKEIRKGKPQRELSREELEALSKAQNKFENLR